jgi:hypothetical protein
MDFIEERFGERLSFAALSFELARNNQRRSYIADGFSDACPPPSEIFLPAAQ